MMERAPPMLIGAHRDQGGSGGADGVVAVLPKPTLYPTSRSPTPRTKLASSGSEPRDRVLQFGRVGGICTSDHLNSVLRAKFALFVFIISRSRSHESSAHFRTHGTTRQKKAAPGNS